MALLEQSVSTGCGAFGGLRMPSFLGAVGLFLTLRLRAGALADMPAAAWARRAFSMGRSRYDQPQSGLQKVLLYASPII